MVARDKREDHRWSDEDDILTQKVPEERSGHYDRGFFNVLQGSLSLAFHPA